MTAVITADDELVWLDGANTRLEAVLVSSVVGEKRGDRRARSLLHPGGAGAARSDSFNT